MLFQLDLRFQQSLHQLLKEEPYRALLASNLDSVPFSQNMFYFKTSEVVHIFSL